MKKTLTVLALPTLPTGEYWDTTCTGLVFRVGSRRRTWAVRHRVHGIYRRDPIGPFPKVGLAEARKAAAEIIDRAQAGLPPPSPTPHPTSSTIVTLGTVIDRYGAMREREGGRIKNLKKSLSTLRREFAGHLKRPVASLTKDDIRNVRDAISGTRQRYAGGVRAAHPWAVLQWALREDIIAVNPVLAVRKPTTVSRERVLTDAELRAIWKASSGNASHDRITRLLMLTGQRRDEVASLTHGEIAGDAWRQADNKSGRPHLVILSPLARELVGTGDDAALVCPGIGGGKFNSWSRCKRDLDQASGLAGWRLHDIRRSVATRMEALGIQANVIEAILNSRWRASAAYIGEAISRSKSARRWRHGSVRSGGSSGLRRSATGSSGGRENSTFDRVLCS